MDRSRWSNYPICLGHIAQMVLDALRTAGHDSLAMTDGLVAAVARVVNRYAIPEGMDREFWARAHAYIEQRLRQASLAAPRPVNSIPKDDYRTFFDQLPIHESLRGFDYELVRNNLRINLCRSYETFIGRADRAALARLLAAPPPTIALPHIGRTSA
jgi:hypothetical protein